MATMHYLFFGILSVAVLFPGRAGTAAVREQKLSGGYAARRSTGPLDGHSDAVAVNCYTGSDLRKRVIDSALQEIGVQEATGNNDGPRVEAYLRYVGLGKGYAWCAAFVSWCYGRAGRPLPRNAWSPALFPKARRYTAAQIGQGSIRQADLFAIYSSSLGRIDHVGLVRQQKGSWIVTVEGNSSDKVLSKRRLLATIYAFSNWMD